MSFDVLQDKIRAMKNPTVAGLDARIDYVPDHIRARFNGVFQMMMSTGNVLGTLLAGALDFDAAAGLSKLP